MSESACVTHNIGNLRQGLLMLPPSVEAPKPQLVPAHLVAFVETQVLGPGLVSWTRRHAGGQVRHRGEQRGRRLEHHVWGRVSQTFQNYSIVTNCDLSSDLASLWLTHRRLLRMNRTKRLNCSGLLRVLVAQCRSYEPAGWKKCEWTRLATLFFICSGSSSRPIPTCATIKNVVPRIIVDQRYYQKKPVR